ncbi:hypothetical protein DFH05DRAFT_1530660 [Lentinula detonsa]|uniref:Uncharacterized protein n=1 Tax=Lentinula detonsa TaxID=2804962 RepID=A0A9W8TSY7_9AGAR|nr:hypothetical protein DFH05DRAFT_1530660 [Lentinula detonsa]KAJ3979906.1 hypothetical protein F5890DRAFT_1558206 [Lentinula detonsa]
MQFAMTVQLNKNKMTRVELPFIRGLGPIHSISAAPVRDGSNRSAARTSRLRPHALSTPYAGQRSRSSANDTEGRSVMIRAPERAGSAAPGPVPVSSERNSLSSFPALVPAPPTPLSTPGSISSVSSSVAPDSPCPSLDRYSSLTPIPETPPPERSGSLSPAPETAVPFLYSTRDRKSRMSATKKTSISWYRMTSNGQISSPPMLPPNHPGLNTNDLFLHIDQLQRRKLEASGKTGKQLFVGCLSMWMWSGRDIGWEIIEFGEERQVNGQLYCLSLYLEHPEPEWVSPKSMKRILKRLA